MLRAKKAEECRELCERRALLEKILVNRNLDIEKCIKICKSVLFF
jgi:hypothetical protein